MARLSLNGPPVLDSTGRTQRNGGIMPPAQTLPAKVLPLASPVPQQQVANPGTVQAMSLSTPAPAPVAPVPAAAPTGVQTAAPVAQATATPPGVQTAVPPTPAYTLPAIDGSQYTATASTGGTAPLDPSASINVPVVGNGAALPAASQSGKVVQNYLNDLLSQNGSYIQDAARRGLETAASRGLLNSSIAAGASTRAAIEAAQPILNDIMGLHGQRENQTFTQSENVLDRKQAERLQSLNLKFQGQQANLDRAQTVNNMLLQGNLAERLAGVNANIEANRAAQDFEFRRTLQSDAAAQQDWLATNQFNNQFNANLSLIPVTNSMQMLQALSQYALEDPETFTPEIMSGFTTFFNNNMVNLLSEYFPNNVSGGNS